MSACPNRIIDEERVDEPGYQGRECGDEGEMCHECYAKEKAYWGAYFGQDNGAREERAARLKAMDPRPISDEEHARNYFAKDTGDWGEP